MGNRSSTMVIVPDKEVMLKVIEKLVDLEEKIKKGDSLTRVQELERKQLLRVAKVMRSVQNASVNRLGDFI